MAPVVVRRVRGEDLEDVLEIESLSFIRPYPPSYLYTLAHLSPETFPVAVLDHHVIGYAVFSMRGRTTQILSLAVHPDHRRRGVGATLLTWVVEEAKRRNTSSIRLEVRRSNLSAQRLYSRLGFSPLHIAHSYYDDGEDALIMELPL